MLQNYTVNQGMFSHQGVKALSSRPNAEILPQKLFSKLLEFKVSVILRLNKKIYYEEKFCNKKKLQSLTENNSWPENRPSKQSILCYD